MNTVRSPIGRFAIVGWNRTYRVRYNLKGDMIVNTAPPLPILIQAARGVESRLLETNRMAVYGLPEA